MLPCAFLIASLLLSSGHEVFHLIFFQFEKLLTCSSWNVASPPKYIMQKAERDVITTFPELPKYLLTIQLPEDSPFFQGEIGCIHI